MTDTGTGTLSGPRVVGVVGRSGSGKTTLLERLVCTLAERGLRVGAVKHASHGFLADRPGKDSYRLYEAGADAVALVSAEQLATFTRHTPEPAADIPLSAALRSLPPKLDLVVVEGFSWEPIPRIVIVPPSEEALPQHLSGGEVLRVVSPPPTVEGTKPVYPEAVVTTIADALCNLAGVPRPEASRPATASRAPSGRESGQETWEHG